jgi:hypothetical protein
VPRTGSRRGGSSHARWRCCRARTAGARAARRRGTAVRAGRAASLTSAPPPRGLRVSRALRRLALSVPKEEPMSTLPDSLVGYRQLLEDAVRDDLARGPRSPPAEGRPSRVRSCGDRGPRARLASVFSGPASAQSVLRHAAAAVAATPGTILHIDITATQDNATNSTVTWHEQSWQLDSPPYSRRLDRTPTARRSRRQTSAAGTRSTTRPGPRSTSPRSRETPAQRTSRT